MARSIKKFLDIKAAIALHKQGELGLAMKIYECIQKNHPNYSDSPHMMGVIAFQTRRYKDADKLISDAIEINPTAASYYSTRGLFLIELMQFNVAIQNFDKAISLKPDYAEAYSNRGIALQKLSEFDAAIASFDQAISLLPKHADLYFNKANALKETEDLEGALSNFRWPKSKCTKN